MDHEAWPARAAMLAALGAILGIVIDRLLDGGDTHEIWRASAASFVAVAGITFAVGLERLRWLWSALFALACGAVVALVFYWNGTPDGWSADEGWRMFASILAVAIAVPLFQSVRDEGRWSLRSPEIHAYAWTNLVLWGAVCAFTLISFLLSHLLAELFNLIGIGLLRDALRNSWFVGMIVGAALGAGVGLLRDRDKVLGLLQRVVTTVLSVLAPVLATGLVLFVLALPFTGLQSLWDKTSATTPILLLAIAGAFILANAVIGNSPEEEAKGRALRLSAMALGAVMAPLAIVAALSTWLRIDQHGLTPERLWALVFVLVVLAVSLAYLWALVRGRFDWAGQVRPANVRLAVGICIVALLLATPLIDFGAISTRDQIARLQSGKVAPEKFDWAALRFDFGPSGVRALEALQRQGAPKLRQLAAQALRSKERWALTETTAVPARAERVQGKVRILPQPVPLPPELSRILATGSICAAGDCTVFWQPGASEAVAIGFGCPECAAGVTRLVRGPEGDWQTMNVESPAQAFPQQMGQDPQAQRGAVAAGRVEIRDVRRRQVYVDGQPVSGTF
ncbi:MAG TPA: DUF4153 domain-containing protein [Allosphingosinicella sp.]